MIYGTFSVGMEVNVPCSENSTSKELINILREGVKINERFKKSLSQDNHAAYAQLRQRSESFIENEIASCETRVLEILSSRNDHELAKVFLEVVVSYENSADENIADYLSEIYLRNPIVIEQAMSTFTLPDQAIVIRQIKFGWENIKSTLDNETAINGEVRLKQLSPKEFRKAP